MANKTLFSNNTRNSIPFADTINNAGGVAYSLSNLGALAQVTMTGTFNNTFYVSAKDQLNTIKDLLSKVGPGDVEFVAKLAIHARKNGLMKDTPAFLLAWLTANAPQYVSRVFPQVVDNGKMLRNFVQIMRSGAVGRKSLGTAPKRLVKNWVTDSTVHSLLRASVGNSPSLADIIKMVHPAPVSLEQNTLFQWILYGKVKSKDFMHLPTVVQDLIRFRAGETDEVPEVPFELLTSSPLSKEQWKKIALKGGWHMVRMNLNTFERQGLFEDSDFVCSIAQKLGDRKEIAKARVFPYQIFTAWKYARDVPRLIQKALEEALEYSLETVPAFTGKTFVFVDVSGSMTCPITGYNGSASSQIRCVDVAALFASSLLRVSPNNTEVVMFDTRVRRAKLNPHGSVMENSTIIASFGGGGTACQVPLQELVANRGKGDLIIYISDDESWIGGSSNRRCATATLEAWRSFKSYNPNAKMVCIDITPNTTTQAVGEDVLNIGGFSDAVYDVIANFLNTNGSSNFWVDEINKSVVF